MEKMFSFNTFPLWNLIKPLALCDACLYTTTIDRDMCIDLHRYDISEASIILDIK